MSQLEKFILARRAKLGIKLVLSRNATGVIKSHLQSVINTRKSDLLAQKKFDEASTFAKLDAASQLEQIDEETVGNRLRAIKSISTRAFAKNVYSTYLGIRARLERAIVDDDGNPIEGNKFMTAWLTPALASELFSQLKEGLTPATAPTVLACCLVVGTALRIASVSKLTLDEIDTLLRGESIVVKITKTQTTRVKQCLAAFLTNRLDATMLVVDGEPIIQLANSARALIDGPGDMLACASPCRDFFTSCIPTQTAKFGIRDQQVRYDYGAGFHELRRFSISWALAVPLANNPQRNQIIRTVGDHAAPSGSTVDRYTSNIINDHGLFTPLDETINNGLAGSD